jgi:hypothetical protein
LSDLIRPDGHGTISQRSEPYTKAKSIEIEGDWMKISAAAAKHKDRRQRLTILGGAPDVESAKGRPILEVLREIAASPAPAEQPPLPDDFCDQLDHYVYGTPKR